MAETIVNSRPQYPFDICGLSSVRPCRESRREKHFQEFSTNVAVFISFCCLSLPRFFICFTIFPFPNFEKWNSSGCGFTVDVAIEDAVNVVKSASTQHAEDERLHKLQKTSKIRH